MVREPILTINLRPIRQSIREARRRIKLIEVKTREPIRIIKRESRAFMVPRKNIPRITKRFKRNLRAGKLKGIF